MVPPVLDPFSWSVGKLASPVEGVHEFNSIYSVAEELAESGFSALPVIRNGVYVGLIREEDLTRGLALGMDSNAPIADLMVASPRALRGSELGEQALDLFSESGSPVLAVTDDLGLVIGVLTPSRLIVTNEAEVRPRMVGGMATPIGVYLSTGAVRGGVGPLALVLTGATMLLMFLVGTYAAMGIGYLVSPQFLENDYLFGGVQVLGLVFFLLLLKATPLAGYHGAEHMVVHAIEQGEPLEMETVRRMPRVHPRCGTNIAVAAMLFLGISQSEWVAEPELRLFAALLVTVVLWRPLGSFAQLYLTTKKPNDKELMAGIDAGKKLLANYQTARVTVASPAMRLLNSGLFHIMAGSSLTATLAYGIMVVLNVPMAWRVL